MILVQHAKRVHMEPTALGCSEKHLRMEVNMNINDIYCFVQQMNGNMSPTQWENLKEFMEKIEANNG